LGGELEPLIVHRVIISTLEKYQEDKMVKQAAKFTFPPELIKDPIIYNLGRQFKVVTNIRRADVNGDIVEG